MISNNSVLILTKFSVMVTLVMMTLASQNQAEGGVQGDPLETDWQRNGTVICLFIFCCCIFEKVRPK